MKTIFRQMFLSLALFLVAAVLSLNANAQCGTPNSQTPSASKLTERSVSPNAVHQTAASQGPENHLFEPAIVGFWRVKFIVKGPDDEDIVVDDAFAQWHADGTEIMNSSKPPATSNFCLGVWGRTAPLTYKLNHFAISSNLNGDLVGPANIREDVTLDKRGNTYTGTLSIDQFDTKGNNIMHVAGTVAATRITVNTKPEDLF